MDMDDILTLENQMAKFLNPDKCRYCGVSKSELEDTKFRLAKSEELLGMVLKYNDLSPGEWVMLVLDIIKFDPKS